jgi:hypothetical protein
VHKFRSLLKSHFRNLVHDLSDKYKSDLNLLSFALIDISIEVLGASSKD